MNYNHTPSLVCITGTKGSGKTTELIKRLRTSPHKHKFIFDPRREFATKLGVKPATTIKEVLEHTKRGFVCFDSGVMFPAKKQEAFSWFCRYVYEVSCGFNGPKILVVDEIQDLQGTSNNSLPDSLILVSDTGRREEIDMLIVTQRPNEVHNSIRSQYTEIITFRHTDRLQLKWLEQSGFDAQAVKRLKCPGGKIGLKV